MGFLLMTGLLTTILIMLDVLELLEQCKTWNGPVTMDSLEDLERLDEHQLLIEVRYLRATIAPDIREKRKEGNKFVKFTKEELVFQIKNAIKPTAESAVDVESLLSCVMGLDVETRNNQVSLSQGEAVSEQVLTEGAEKELQVAEPRPGDRENPMQNETHE